MSSTQRTAAEAKLENIRIMGSDLGSLYDALWQDLAWVYHKWDEYVQLFGKQESRIELLNRAAPAFFRVVQDTLWEDVLLHIARLTDKAATSGKANLSVLRLPNLIDDAPLKSRLDELNMAVMASTEFCRDWRNRRIAHTDLGLALGHGVDPLLPASREKVKVALASIAAVLDAVSLHYKKSTTFFEVDGSPGGAVQLLYVIDDGLQANDERKKRWKQGLYSDDDTKHRDL